MSQEIFKPYDRMKEMKHRASMSQGRKAALVNLLKDELRANWDSISVYEGRESHLRIEAHRFLDQAISDLSLRAKIDGRCWQERTTRFGSERNLSSFGRWLLSVYEYYLGVTDRNMNSILNDALRQVGLGQKD